MIQYRRNRLIEMLKVKSDVHSTYIQEEYNKVCAAIAQFPKYTQKQCAKMIKQFHKNTLHLIKEKQEKEYALFLGRKAEQDRENAEKQKFKQEVKELFEFKKRKKSIEALPLKHSYSWDVIKKAESEMRYIEMNKYFDKIIREEAIRYYQSNDLDTEPNIGEREDDIYIQVRKDPTLTVK